MRLDGYEIEVLEAEDIEEQPMRDLWIRSVEFLDKVLREGGCVAVHCAQGVSRSASTCLAYLMIREGLSLEAAFRRVFTARDFIRPNPGFWQQLRDLETSLFGKSGGVDNDQDPKHSSFWHGLDAAGQALLRLDEELRQKKLAVAAGWSSAIEDIPSQQDLPTWACLVSEASLLEDVGTVLQVLDLTTYGSNQGGQITVMPRYRVRRVGTLSQQVAKIGKLCFLCCVGQDYLEYHETS
eukprot:s5257_g4.t1